MKIEAKDLRIGNLIDSGEIEGLLKNSAIIDGIHVHITNIKPIPLTEEWLLRFGFVKKDEGYGFLTSMKQAVLICFGNHNCAINGLSFNNPTKYVHQLQNLFFALIGEELEIK